MVRRIEGHYRSVTAVSRPAGVKLAERAIDKALALKKAIRAASRIKEAANAAALLRRLRSEFDPKDRLPGIVQDLNLPVGRRL
jgi:hypothetical protein